MKFKSNLLEVCWVPGSVLGSLLPSCSQQNRRVDREFQLGVVGARTEGCQGGPGHSGWEGAGGEPEEREDRFLL